MSVLVLSMEVKNRPVPKKIQRFRLSSCVSVGAAVIGPTVHGDAMTQVVACGVV